MTFEDLKGGLTIDQALAAFRDGIQQCRWKHVIISGYFDKEFAATARAALPDRITDVQASAMRRIVQGTLTMSLPSFLAWVQQAADRTADEYVEAAAEARASIWRRAQRRHYEAWRPDAPARETGFWSFSAKAEQAVSAAKAKYSDGIEPCSSCGSPSSELHWRYGRFGFMDEEESDWKGWVVTCERCQLGIGLLGGLDEAPGSTGRRPGPVALKNPYFGL
jgi:hypothetical protein